MIIVVIALVALIVASITDIRTREVPDFLNYGLIIVGLVVNLIYSVVYGEWGRMLESVVGFLACLLFGLVMFYTGQWGGGDSKFLMGMGALIGLPVLSLNVYNPPFLLLFLLFTFILGAFYGLLWVLGCAVIYWKKVFVELKKALQEKNVVRIRIGLMVMLVLVLIGVIFLHDNSLKIMIAGMGAVVVLSFYLILIVKVIEKNVMERRVALSKVTEGDWIAEEVKVKGKLICGPKDLGISLKQMALLKKLKVKKVLVKYGIPFVPSFLMAYIVTYFWGELIYLWFIGLM